jgi:mRNA-degrading endonuclease RelE of RelBE toxin-antitoxin system
MRNTHMRGVYGLVFERDAVKGLTRLPADVRVNMRARLEEIAVEPNRTHGSFEPLARDLAGLYKLRVTQWRAIVAIDHDSRTIRVTRVGHRREIYG